MDKSNALEEIPIHLREFAKWQARSIFETAHRLLFLLDLDGADIREELERTPEAQPAIVAFLLDSIESGLGRNPVRAHELSAVIVPYAGRNFPLEHTWAARDIRYHAWMTHARLLCTLGRFAEAEEAIATAWKAFRQLEREVRVRDLDVIRLVKARILHGLGDSARALRLIRRAAKNFLCRDRLRYAEAAVVEMQIHRDLGDSAAEDRAERNAIHMAWENDFIQLAYLNQSLGRYWSCHGDLKVAAFCFVKAQMIFKIFRPGCEDSLVRRDLAEATAKLGHFPKALRLYRRVRKELLAGDHLADAAIVSTEILDTLLLAGHERHILREANTLIRTFRKATLPIHARHAWAFVEERARAGALTREDVALVRGYFERLFLRPNTRFGRERVATPSPILATGIAQSGSGRLSFVLVRARRRPGRRRWD